MSDTVRLVVALKQQLRANGFTYAKVAVELGLSEATVKRMFSTGNFTIERLGDLCVLMNMEFRDLVKSMEETRKRITRLTEAQERELVSDPWLLLVAVCTRHYWTFEEIVGFYKLDDNECVQLLARLDRLKLIELQPGNRIRLMIAHDFSWIPHGPIEQFFEKQVQPEFLHSRFDGDDQLRVFATGMLSHESIQILLKKLKTITEEIAERQIDDAVLPVFERENVGLLLAMRSWELSVFRDLQRQPR